MDWNNGQLHVVGIGGTLREHSNSLAALEVALQAAEATGATTELLSLNDLRLPMYEPDKPLEEYDENVQRFMAAVRRADAFIWSTAAYNGTLAGVTKNAIDYFHFLDKDEPPYLHEKVVGLIAVAAGDVAALNAVNAMVYSVHSLRGTVAPLLVAIPNVGQMFNDNGDMINAKWRGRLEQLGRLVVENGAKFVQPEPQLQEIALGE